MLEKHNYLILPAADTLEHWKELGCIPEKRELIAIYDDDNKDNVKFKLGDGVTPLEYLDYITEIKDLLPYFNMYITHSSKQQRVTVMMNPNVYHEHERKVREAELEDKT